MAENLLGAVLAVQAEAPTLQKDALNPHFRSKYLSLESLMEKVLPILNKHGLVWMTLPTELNGEPALTYRLAHASSGEAIEGTMLLLLAKKDAQGQGSAITYSRRYSLMSVLGLVTDEDDDGNAAGVRTVTAGPVQSTERAASAKQRGLINGKAHEKNLLPVDLAQIVLAATEAPSRAFDDQSQAEDWLRRAMDRLPARYVDPILAGIAAHE